MRDLAHDAFVLGGLVEPVARDGVDDRRWLDCELGSLAENRLDDHADPLDVDPARRARWRALATEDWRDSLDARDGYEVPYWLLEGGRRVGTVALSTTAYGAADLRVGSFYVFRSRRGMGTGRRALDRLRAVVATLGIGLRLDTCWSWQRTVRFYLRAGLWVHMWKRDLTLRWDARCPPYALAVGPLDATLTVARDGADVVLARAHRRGDELRLDEPSRELLADRSLGEAPWDAVPTLSLGLALEAWPLVRSRELWEQVRHADGGPPESLAYKIALWEAWDRHHGWRVETPKIPGLEYPTWEDLNERWDAETASLRVGPT
jgi:GNAT superfamily N-acetyltransferase